MSCVRVQPTGDRKTNDVASDQRSLEFECTAVGNACWVLRLDVGVPELNGVRAQAASARERMLNPAGDPIILLDTATDRVRRSLIDFVSGPTERHVPLTNLTIDIRIREDEVRSYDDDTIELESLGPVHGRHHKAVGRTVE